jgi:hypothetical protein
MGVQVPPRTHSLHIVAPSQGQIPRLRLGGNRACDTNVIPRRLPRVTVAHAQAQRIWQWLRPARRARCGRAEAATVHIQIAPTERQDLTAPRSGVRQDAPCDGVVAPAGSPIGFTDRGLRELKGLSEARRVYLVEPSG